MKKKKAEVETKNQTILSIDLGRNGAMVLWSKGNIISSQQWDRDERLYMYQDIYRILEIIFEIHTAHRLDVIVTERVRFARLQFQMALAYDIGKFCKLNKIIHVLYAPTSVKTVVGKRPSKEQIINYSSAYLGRQIKSEHLADAIIIGLKYIKTGVVKNVKPNRKFNKSSK